MTLQTLADWGDDLFTTRVGNVTGFSLHAGVATKANERAKLERLCRYITRPAVSTNSPILDGRRTVNALHPTGYGCMIGFDNIPDELRAQQVIGDEWIYPDDPRIAQLD